MSNCEYGTIAILIILSPQISFLCQSNQKPQNSSKSLLTLSFQANVHHCRNYCSLYQLPRQQQLQTLCIVGSSCSLNHTIAPKNIP